jgi:hypothetical protein
MCRFSKLLAGEEQQQKCGQSYEKYSMPSSQTLARLNPPKSDSALVHIYGFLKYILQTSHRITALTAVVAVLLSPLSVRTHRERPREEAKQ